jgi:mRNA-degrading endonuclease toxin of MazEF toxin-antitoxin module
MTCSRGAVYSLAGYPPPAGLLVLTNDLWNEHMSSVGGVLVTERDDMDAFPVHVRGGGCANPSMGMALPHARLGPTPVYRATADEMKAVEASLSAVLHIRRLAEDPPSIPGSPSGPANFPLWGEVYYGPEVKGQAKRHVVVSANVHNSFASHVLAVRLTSRAKRDTMSFPLISGGSGQACCGDLSLLPHDQLRYQPGDGRPHPSSLSIEDMANVSRGICQTHCR